MMIFTWAGVFDPDSTLGVSHRHNKPTILRSSLQRSLDRLLYLLAGAATEPILI
jgi:hypothetical protein